MFLVTLTNSASNSPTKLPIAGSAANAKRISSLALSPSFLACINLYYLAAQHPQPTANYNKLTNFMAKHRYR